RSDPRPGLVRGGRILDHRAAARQHSLELAFIERELAATHEVGLEAVVVTHHAPSPQCIHRRYAGSALNAGFASDLEETILRFEPALWIHGHVHNAVDVTVGRTRILANPHGYDAEEAATFVPDLVVEL
ncbi:MAG: hypothetical protein OXI73_03580, partial [Rhodospirillales bacterium]|nr:hypothetical protein [Rhodospirillales bacterium]